MVSASADVIVVRGAGGSEPHAGVPVDWVVFRAGQRASADGAARIAHDNPAHDIPLRHLRAFRSRRRARVASHAKKIAVIVPIVEGQRDTVRDYLAEGAPFGYAAAGIDRHEVFLTGNEAIFVFASAEGLPKLNQILVEPELWDVVSAWEHVIAARPRLAEVVVDFAAASSQP